MNVPKNTSSKTPMMIGISVGLVILIVSVIFLTFRSGEKRSLEPDEESDEEPDEESEVESEVESDSGEFASVPSTASVSSQVTKKPIKSAKNKPLVFKQTGSGELSVSTEPSLPLSPPPPKGPKPGTLPRPPMNAKGEKSVNELTDEEYVKYNLAWRHKNFGGTYDKNDHPDRFKRKFQQQKIDLLKKPKIFYYLPGHSRSYNFDLKNNRAWKGYKDETGDVDESRIIEWLDAEYVNKSKGNICPNPSNPRGSKTCFFPNHTRTINEIIELRNTNATAITNDLNQKLQAQRELLRAHVNRR